VAEAMAGRTLFEKVWEPHVIEDLGDGTQLLHVDRHLMNELSGHRGQIRGSDSPRPGTVQILAQAPLSELESFPARLKSITAGHGSYSLEFSHYEPAPPQLQHKLVAAHKPHAEAE